jgi:uncharacterized protein (TIGR03790 family)
VLPWLAVAASAGLGPAHVLVLYNAASPEAADVAEHYAIMRSLLPEQLCPVDGVDPEARSLSWEDYQATVQPALVACLASQPDPDRIDALVTVRGLPPRVDLPGYPASLQAVLQVEGARYGDAPLVGQPQEGSAWVDNPTFVDGACASDELTLSNPYASWYTTGCALGRLDRWPRGFERAAVDHPWYAGGLYVMGRLDGFDFADARDLVDRGVAADGAMPGAPMVCMAAADAARGARDPECERVVRLLAAKGHAATWLPEHNAALSGLEVSAYVTGASNLIGAIDGLSYAPGAFADNLTSYGAVPENLWCAGADCPGAESQTSIARFIRAGATGAVGTVAEPLNNCFPNAGSLLYYREGYSLGESLLYAQRFLYWQVLLLGDPLATPFAVRPTVGMDPDVPEGTPLTVWAEHPDGVQEVRLYADGVEVARAEGDRLDWVPPGIDGDEVEVLAVAVRRNPMQDVSGWGVEAHRPRPDVQGWQRVVVRVGPAPEPSDTGVVTDTGASKDSEAGCGCSASGPPGGQLLVGLLVLAGCRRRSR